MPENPTDLSSSAANIATVKRYAPPNQRNRSLNRRKSGGDRFERMNMHANDGKNQAAASRNVPVADRVDVIGSNIPNENPRLGLITLHGCCKSEAFQLLNARWAAAINAFNDPSTDLAKKPAMYPGSGAPAWGNARLPHQLMPPTVSAGPSSGSQMDFLRELRRAIRDANANSGT